MPKQRPIISKRSVAVQSALKGALRRQGFEVILYLYHFIDILIYTQVLVFNILELESGVLVVLGYFLLSSGFECNSVFFGENFMSVHMLATAT